jgi:hypothetical protein
MQPICKNSCSAAQGLQTCWLHTQLLFVPARDTMMSAGTAAIDHMPGWLLICSSFKVRAVNLRD